MKNHDRRLSVIAWLQMGLILAASGCGSPAVVPKSYKTYNHPEGTFALDYPAEWECQGGGKGTFACAKFTSGDAEIAVSASVVGSLMAGPNLPGVDGPGMTRSEEHLPVSRVHEDEKEGFEEDEGVKEQNPSIVQTKLGDARKSEFTGTKTFGGEIHGCRVTALSRDYRLRIVCQCPKAEWQSLKPAFDKAIESLGMGRTQY